MGSSSSRSTYPKPFSGKIKFDRNDVLGTGNAVVYRGTFKNQKVAVKRIQLTPSTTADVREFATQIKLDHRNVLKILTVEDGKDFRFIVLEICSGTLKEVCNGTHSGPDLPPDEIVLKEIATGLKHIHSNQLVHRDIKPENILISSTTPAHIKLSDFGLSKETSSCQTYTVSGYKGTLKWMAPELHDMANDSSPPNQTENKKRGSCKSDIFSAGCVFFYFVTRGFHPHGEAIDSHDTLIVRNILENRRANIAKLQINHFASDVIIGMIAKQPQSRMSLEDVLILLDNDVPAPLNSSSHYGTYNGRRNAPIESTIVNRATTFTTVDRQFRIRTNDVRIWRNVEQHFL